MSDVSKEERALLNYLLDNRISETTVAGIDLSIPRSFKEKVLRKWEREGLVKTRETYSAVEGGRVMNLVTIRLDDLDYYRSQLDPDEFAPMGQGVPVEQVGSSGNARFRQDYFPPATPSNVATPSNGVPEGPFDVFMCHNSLDKPEVIRIAGLLREHGLRPWLDAWHLRPGFPWQQELQKQIKQIRTAAVFVGQSGLGPWQERELDALLQQFVSRQCPVIPVVLGISPAQPELPLFLTGMTWVDFRLDETEAMRRLVWGITGENPNA